MGEMRTNFGEEMKDLIKKGVEEAMEKAMDAMRQSLAEWFKERKMGKNYAGPSKLSTENGKGGIEIEVGGEGTQAKEMSKLLPEMPALQVFDENSERIFVQKAPKSIAPGTILSNTCSSMPSYIYNTKISAQQVFKVIPDRNSNLIVEAFNITLPTVSKWFVGSGENGSTITSRFSDKRDKVVRVNTPDQVAMFDKTISYKLHENEYGKAHGTLYVNYKNVMNGTNVFPVNFETNHDTALCYKIHEDRDVVKLADDEDLHDIMRQSLNPLRIIVKLNTERNLTLGSHGRSNGSSNTIRSQPLQPPLQVGNTTVSEVLNSLPGTVCEAVSKFSTDLGLDTSSPAGYLLILDSLAKMALTYLKEVSPAGVKSGPSERSTATSVTKDNSSIPAGTTQVAELKSRDTDQRKPVGHSKSPILYNEAFRSAGFKGVYVHLLVDLQKVLGSYSSTDFAGFSCTLPHKNSLSDNSLFWLQLEALFRDGISSGLDSSTTYQIISCLRQLAHITDATILVSLLQPAPETYEIFDDVMLMAEGKIVFHGPRIHILEFFEGCGFRCPERKGVANFLQEILSRKDQAQYWYRTEHAYTYVSVGTFSEKFKESPFRKKLEKELSEAFLKSKSHDDSISFDIYSISKWNLFKACMSREFLLMRRNSFIYIFKTVQLIIIAFITMTVSLRNRMDVDVVHANKYLGALFYSLAILLVDGLPELFLNVPRLSILYKQQDLRFYPAWGYAIPAAFLKVPLSLLESLIGVTLTYYVIRYNPEPGGVFRHLLLLFALHWTSVSMFRFVASLCRNIDVSTTAGSLTVLVVLLFSGFIIPKTSTPVWLTWAFWFSPLAYGEIGLTVNEFLDDGSMLRAQLPGRPTRDCLFTDPARDGKKQFSEFHLEDKWTTFLIDIYNELLPNKDFEVIFVAVDDICSESFLASGRDPQKIFESLFARMPWTAIPFSDLGSRKRIAKRFGVLGGEFFCAVKGGKLRVTCSVSLDSRGMVLKRNACYLFEEYGTPGHPFTKERIKFLDSVDDAVAKQPSLESLLGSPERDYVISNKGDRVPIHTLKDKVVALYFYEDGLTNYRRPELTPQLEMAYKELKNKENFEVVLLYLYDTCGTLHCTNEESFWNTLKTMPWLALPFKDSNHKKLKRIFGYPGDLEGAEEAPTLVIIGPNVEFVDPCGADILNEFGTFAYPFTRRKVAKLETERIKELKLEMLWDPNTVFRVKNDGLEIPFSQFAGKRVLIYFEMIGLYQRTHWEKILRLKDLYLKMKGTEDEFEVIYIKDSLYTRNPDSLWIVPDYGELPWLVHYYDEGYSLPKELEQSIFHFNCSHGRKGCQLCLLVAFERGGSLVRKTFYPTINDVEFPFYAGGLEKEYLNQLDHHFGWYYWDYMNKKRHRIIYQRR